MIRYLRNVNVRQMKDRASKVWRLDTHATNISYKLQFMSDITDTLFKFGFSAKKKMLHLNYDATNINSLEKSLK